MSDREDEFRDVFERHSDELFRHALLRLSNRERALELTQESFVRAWEYMRRGNEIEQYRPFLYRTLNNLIIDEYRKRKTHSLDAIIEESEMPEYTEGVLLSDASDPKEDAAVRFDGKRALLAIQGLPEMYRTVVVMRYIDGLSPSEIARCLEESENVVSVRIHRGLRKIRELLASYPDESLP